MKAWAISEEVEAVECKFNDEFPAQLVRMGVCFIAGDNCFEIWEGKWVMCYEGDWVVKNKGLVWKVAVYSAASFGKQFTTQSLQPVAVVQDDSSHWYVIPAEMRREFFVGLGDDEDEEYDSFDVRFGKYRIGVDLGRIQLWAEIKQQ